MKRHGAVVLEAPPGAGKTTRVPAALLRAFGSEGEILVLEPRRLATRMSARRVAQELGESLGEVVGYQVRFEDVTSPRTRLRFVTEGILTRRLMSDPQLKGVRAVVLDEFHERHLHTDLALSWIAQLRRTRPDLALIVMSATLDAQPVADFLQTPARIRSEGRAFEVTVQHQKTADDRPIQGQVLSALRQLVSENLDGDVLVFLPGQAEIRRCLEAAAPLAREHDLLLLPLHGELSPDEQDRAVRKADKRKVVFSTNVAETSVTIDGVVAVIDTGLARIAEHAAWSGLPTLKLSRIAQAACVQRAGRAGRTRPGRCIRLFTSQDFGTRAKFETPEIRRVDLSDFALTLASLPGAASLPWFEPPKPDALTAAQLLLRRLGFAKLGDSGASLTEEGKWAAQLPLHPRLAKLVIEARRRGSGDIGCLAATMLSERGMDLPRTSDVVEHSDVWVQIEEYQRLQRAGRGGDANAMARLRRASEQLQRHLQRLHIAEGTRDKPALALQHALHAGFVDRVGRVRVTVSTGKAEVVFANGGAALLADKSVCVQSDLVVAVEADERIENGRSVTTVRQASEIEAAWIFERSFDDLEEDERIEVNPRNKRVEQVRSLRLGQLVLEETRQPADTQAMAKMLGETAVKKGLAQLVPKEKWESLLQRLAYLRRLCPELLWEPLDERELTMAWARYATSLKDFDTVSAEFVVSELRGGDVLRKLNEWAPERVTLPGGRKLTVYYSDTAAPWVESRLQDFFGMRSVPKIAGGRDAIVLHLLAPNGRDVQVTTDLEGFWTRHYPAIAAELKRKYPRHAWPDDPANSQPSEPLRRRPR